MRGWRGRKQEEDWYGPDPSDDRYTDDGYGDDRSGGYAEARYPEPGYGEQGYGEQGYDDRGYRDQAYGRQAYDERGYESQAYDERAYEERSYDERGYDRQRYERPAYPRGYEEPQGYDDPRGYEERPGYRGREPREPRYDRPRYPDQGRSYYGGGPVDAYDGATRNGASYDDGRYDSAGYDRGNPQRLNGYQQNGYPANGANGYSADPGYPAAPVPRDLYETAAASSVWEPASSRKPAEPQAVPVPAPPSAAAAAASRPYGRISIFTLLDDKVAEFDRLAEETAEAVRLAEPDTLVYVIHLVPKAPLQRIFYEIYRDREAFELHELQTHNQRFESERRAYVLATNVIELRLKYAKVAPLSPSAKQGQQELPAPANGQPVYQGQRYGG